MSSVNIHSNVGPWSGFLSNYPPGAAHNIAYTIHGPAVHISWDDADESISTDSEGYTVKWYCAKLVRKVGSMPNNVDDGTVIVTSTVHDQYRATPYIDSSITTNTKYYYRVFTCSTDGIWNRECSDDSWCTVITGSSLAYRTATLTIDLSKSNPSSWATISGTGPISTTGKGSAAIAAWQDFFGYRACLFKDGKPVGYLKNDDFSTFTNGESADITSGKAGDVMIQFPRRGLRITHSGSILTIKFTEDPNDSNYDYFAHTRGTVNKDYFYLGAYLTYMYSDILDGSTPDSYSISHVWPAIGESYAVGSSGGNLGGALLSTGYWMNVENQYKSAIRKGTGYGIIGWYQWIYIQCMYMMQFKGDATTKNLTSLSQGRFPTYKNADRVVPDDFKRTGYCDKLGMVYADGWTVKLFGLENVFGYGNTYFNNMIIGSDNYIYTTTDDTITDTSKYTKIGANPITPASSGASKKGYISNVIGTSNSGFFPKAVNGSDSTYLCDYAMINSGNRVPCSSGHANTEFLNGGGLGMFSIVTISVRNSKQDSETSIVDLGVGRLMYL